MNLKTKALINTVIFGLVITLFVVVSVYQSMISGFQDVESQFIEKDVRSAHSWFEQQLEVMDQKISDWSNWNDSYKYALDRNKEFEISNLDSLLFGSIGIDGVIFFDDSGKLFKTFGYDRRKNAPMDFGVFGDLSKLYGNSKFSSHKGIDVTADGRLYFFVTHPILKSDLSGKPAGVIGFIRLMLPKDNNDIQKIVSQNISVIPIVSGGSESDTLSRTSTTIKSTSYLVNNSGVRVASIILSEPREIYLLGKSILLKLLVWIGFFLIVSSIINYFSLFYLLIIRIEKTKKIINDIIKSKDLKSRIPLNRTNDEFDELIAMNNSFLADRELAFTSLNNEKNKLEEYLNRISILIFVINDAGKIEFINQYAISHLGCRGTNELEEILGEEFFGSLTSGEHQIKSCKNDQMLIDWEILDFNGKKIVIGKDVTLLREAERKYQERYKQLETLTDSMVDRENRMVEMKNKINELEKMLGKDDKAGN